MSTSSFIFRFGEFRLDLAGRELYRGGTLVPMSPKMFDCLVWLFEHRARAVGRDELSAAVWNKVEVSDGQIDQLISKVRIALRDTGSDREIIRTVPRFGYRWVAEVQQEEALLAPAETASPALARPNRRRAALLVGLAVLLALIAGLALFLDQRGRESTMPSAPGASVNPPAAQATSALSARIAILPVTLEGDADSKLAWLRLGLMDQIATRLREGGLTVVPTSNIVALIPDHDYSAPLSPAAVQGATDASILVSPSVRETRDGWRLHLEVRGEERTARELEVHADDVVTGARDAADRLVLLLGGALPVKDVAQESVEELTLVSHVDALVDMSDYDTARQLLDTAALALRDAAPLRLRRAAVDVLSGHPAAARERLESLLDSHAQTPLDVETRTGALLYLGILLASENKLVDARPRFDLAIELATQSHLSFIYIDAMTSRGVLNLKDGHYGDADRDFAQARVAMQMVGDNYGLAVMEANQAGGLITRHRYAEGRPLLEQSIARLQRFPSTQPNLVAALASKIRMHLALLESRDALAVIDQAKDSLRRIRKESSRNAFMLQEVQALLANGLLGQARQRLDELMQRVDQRQAPSQYFSVLIDLAQLALTHSRMDEAASLSSRAMEIPLSPIPDTPLFARDRAAGWLVRIRALQRQGANSQAAAELQRFDAWAGTQQDGVVVVRASLAQAEQAVAERRPEQAVSAYETALVAANRAAPADVVDVVKSYGGYLIDIGQLDAATRIVGQVARWAGRDFACALLQVQLYHALGEQKAWQESLTNARSLAGERLIPHALTVSPLIEPPSAGRIAVPSSLRQ